MTKILYAQVLRLLAATFFVTTAIYGSPSASAQGPQVIALTTPTATPAGRHFRNHRARGSRPWGRPSRSIGCYEIVG